MSMNPPTVTGGSKGPNWMLIGAAGAVGLGLLALLTSKGSGGTTAGATSINAALGSLQEEQMNTQGQIGLMQQSIGLGQGETLVGHIDANQSQTIGALSDISTQVAGVGANVKSGNEAAATAAKTQADTTAANQAQNLNIFAAIQAVLAQIFGQGQQISAGVDNVNQGVANLHDSTTAQYNALYGEGQFLNQALSGVQSNILNSTGAQYQALYNQGIFLNDAVAGHMQTALAGTY